MRDVWSDMLTAALALGLPPNAFWRLSVKEWRALMRTDVAPLSRSELEALSCIYPDQTHD